MIDAVRRTVLAFAAVLLSCCGREPTLKQVFSGKVEIPTAEQEALAELFNDVKPSQVELLLSPEEFPHGSLAVRIEDGRVTGLRLDGSFPSAPLAVLSELRDLRLRRSDLASLADLGPRPRLRELHLDFAGSARLDGLAACCPSLETLSVVRGEIKDLSPLSGMRKLRELRVEYSHLSDLKTAPPLLALESATFNYGEIASMEGADAFPKLRKLILFGNKSLHDLDELRGLDELRELELYQNAATSLALAALPSLESIKTSDNRLLSANFGDLPKLRRVELRERNLLSVDLATLPALEEAEFIGEGNLFKDGRLRRVRIAEQPRLERLDLSRNHIIDLNDVAPQPTLRHVVLDRNPIRDLSSLAEGFPTLRYVSVRRTRVSELPESMRSTEIVLLADENELEANAWEAVLSQSFKKMEDSFVESLPKSGGSARGHDSRCSFFTGTFREPRLRCTGTIESVSGLIQLPLVQVDPLSPAGGTNRFPVRVSLSTRSGTARLYVKYELDARGLAEALASYTDPERPWLEWGERNSEQIRRGYAFAAARPGAPGTTFGEAHQLVDRLIVWIAGDAAEGVEYVIESPGR